MRRHNGKFVYVVRSEAGPVKIGTATRVAERIAQLRTSSAYPLKLLFAAQTSGNAMVLEREAHSLLHAKRMSGEWFNCTIIDAIDAIREAAYGLGHNLTIHQSLPDLEKQNIFSFRLKPNIREELEAVARSEGRPLGDLIKQILREHVESKG